MSAALIFKAMRKVAEDVNTISYLHPKHHLLFNLGITIVINQLSTKMKKNKKLVSSS